MKREEAIEQLRNLKKANFYPSTIIALDMAIDALTQRSTQDLISRQGAINAIENTDCELTTKDWDELTGALKSLPSAPDSRQRGEWLWDSGDGEYFCSECKTTQGNSTTEIISGEWNFCPNCGADMRGEEE